MNIFSLASIALVPAAIALSGCASNPDSPTRGSCRDSVTLNHSAANLKLTPPVANICAGTTVAVRIRPPAPAGDVHLDAKNDGPDWLEGTNSSEDEILLMVPADEPVDPNNVLEYLVEVEGVGTLDPGFRIIR